MLILNRNTNATPANGGTAVVTPEPESNGTAGPDGNKMVPLWKLGKTTDRLKEVEAEKAATEAKLKEYQDAEKKKLEDEAKARGEFDKLLALKEQERVDAVNEKERLKREREAEKLELAVLKEIEKFAPNSADDVLKFIDISKLKIDESGHIATLKESVEKLKTDKPYLFGSKTNPNFDPTENGRPAAGAESLKAAESEHSKLLSKSQTIGQALTSEEQARMRFLHNSIQKLKNKK